MACMLCVLNYNTVFRWRFVFKQNIGENGLKDGINIEYLKWKGVEIHIYPLRENVTLLNSKLFIKC